MNEKTLQELLIKLGIPANRSYTDICELLDTKLSEYLDRQDNASQELVNSIQDALEYVEKKKVEAGGGIAIVEENQDRVDIDGLRSTTQKNADIENVSWAGSATTNNGKLWFYSLTGAQNIDTMFYQACDDLKYDQFDHAESIFEMILQAEPNNASAYLGKVLAVNHLKEPKELGNAIHSPVDTDINLRRASDHGNDVQKKYIADALAERSKAVQYAEAEKAAQNKDDFDSLETALELFEGLDNFRDAQAKADACRKDIEDLIGRIQTEIDVDKKEMLKELDRVIANQKKVPVMANDYEGYYLELKGNTLSNLFRRLTTAVNDMNAVAFELFLRTKLPVLGSGVQDFDRISGYLKATEKDALVCLSNCTTGAGLKALFLLEEKFYNGKMSYGEKQVYEKVLGDLRWDVESAFKTFLYRRGQMYRDGYSEMYVAERKMRNGNNVGYIPVDKIEMFRDDAIETFDSIERELANITTDETVEDTELMQEISQILDEGIREKRRIAENREQEEKEAAGAKVVKRLVTGIIIVLIVIWFLNSL